MPAQRHQRSTRPATTRAGRTTARRGNDGNGRRNNRAADWPVELTIATAIDQMVEGHNGDPGSATSQRWPTSWQETVLGIDPRTAR
jgi:hypothetical protein